ncbi:MAG: hypothetical protein KatS3mg050_1876 [Litorilinea sp.]|nr:MAG: hypothetical protein KatS3mg050_1876 [Litorilinea sp.]
MVRNWGAARVKVAAERDEGVEVERARWASRILLAIALLLYLATLDNGFQPYELRGGDLITHQYAQVQARPSNAPGYPLYTMGGWLWFHGLRQVFRWLGVTHPNPIPILSSYSTLWALLALWLLYRTGCHLTRSPDRPGGNWPLAWLVAGFYGVTYFFWYYATTTEQYTSAIAQTLAIVYVYLRWREAPEPDNRLLYLLALLSGLSLAHMLTVAFIVPPLVAVMLWQAPGLLRRIRPLAGTVLAALLPLLSYAYVYLRGAAHPEWWGEGPWRTPGEWFWAFVSTAQGREELSWGFEPGRAFFGNGFPELIWQELSIPILILGLVGIALLGRRLAWLLYGTLAIYLGFCWAYRYGNWFQVILPTYPLILLGVLALADRWQRRPWPPAPGWLRTWLPALLLLAAIAWRTTASLPGANSHNRPQDTALDRAAVLLDQPLPIGAGLFAAVDDALALDYLTRIWQIRPDLAVVGSDQAATRLAHHQLVLATWDAAATLRAELPPTLPVTVQSFGADWLAFQHGQAAHPLAAAQGQPVNWTVSVGDNLGDNLRDGEGVVVLERIAVTPAPQGAPVRRQAPPGLDVTLYWRLPATGWPQGLSISLRPTRGGALIPAPEDPAGGFIQQDRPGPAHGHLTLSGWPPDEPVADGYRLPLPAMGQVDGLQLVLYRVVDGGFETVAVLDLPLPDLSGQ